MVPEASNLREFLEQNLAFNLFRFEEVKPCRKVNSYFSLFKLLVDVPNALATIGNASKRLPSPCNKLGLAENACLFSFKV